MKCFRQPFRTSYLIFILGVSLIVAVSARPKRNNDTNSQVPANYIELKLPVKITSVDDLVVWIKNAMQSMASRIDITLASNGNGSNPDENRLKTDPNDQKPSKDDRVEQDPNGNLMQPNYPEFNQPARIESPWFQNDVYTPLVGFDTSLPLFFDIFRQDGGQNSLNLYPNPNRNIGIGGTKPNQKPARQKSSNSNPPNFPSVHDSEVRASEFLNKSEKSSLGEPIPFAIPFEAYITITKEASVEPNQQTLSTSSPKYEDFSNELDVRYVKKKNANSVNNGTNGKVQTSGNSNSKKTNSRKQQIEVLNKLLQRLRVNRKFTVKQKKSKDTYTSSAENKVKFRKHEDRNRQQLFIDPEDAPLRSPRNDSFQRQEFDEDEDDGTARPPPRRPLADDDDDAADDEDDEEEPEGSLGSITELLPLAIPILEDLSDPESEVDLVGLLQAAVPLIGGLSEGDGEGNGGLQEILNTIVPVVTKIIGGLEGTDLGEIIGPVFGLVAPFIGPILAPILGPLLRTVSNPPTEGSSLPVLINAIVGPLTEPQQPSGMSPLSIVIAGATAAILKEIKPGAPGGSDIGSFVAAILSGVISGASAGLSGGLSADKGGGGGGGYDYTPYGAPPAHTSLAALNAGFNRPPALRPPSANSALTFNAPPSKRPPNVASTVNIGSTVRPSPFPVTPAPVQINIHHRPTNNFDRITRPTSPTHLPHSQHYNNGPVPAAATNNGGSSSYLPYGTTTVPANSVNPISLIGSSIQDIIGAGLGVVSSVINAIFGILGASSSSSDTSPPRPSYGPPTSGSYNYASG